MSPLVDLSRSEGFPSREKTARSRLAAGKDGAAASREPPDRVSARERTVAASFLEDQAGWLTSPPAIRVAFRVVARLLAGPPKGPRSLFRRLSKSSAAVAPAPQQPFPRPWISYGVWSVALVSEGVGTVESLLWRRSRGQGCLVIEEAFATSWASTPSRDSERRTP